MFVRVPFSKHPAKVCTERGTIGGITPPQIHIAMREALLQGWSCQGLHRKRLLIQHTPKSDPLTLRLAAPLHGDFIPRVGTRVQDECGGEVLNKKSREFSPSKVSAGR
jgi:hypothetical protein